MGLDTGWKGTRGGGGYRDGHLDSLLRSSTHRYQRGLSRPLEVILSASQGHRLRTFPEWGNIALPLLLLLNEEPFFLETRRACVMTTTSAPRSPQSCEVSRSLKALDAQEKSEVGKWREGWNVSGIRDEIE